MSRLRYTVIASLDGYVVDASDDFSWAAPDEEVHAFVNDRERDVGTYLYGRRLYETMAVWADLDAWPRQAVSAVEPSAVVGDYAAVWQAAEKIVYSSTLEAVTTARTRLERTFDPEAVRQMLESSARDISIGGPHLAASAIRAGLVDDYELLVVPHVVGGGTGWLPDDVRLELDLVDESRFTSGVVHLAYRIRR